jgi:hypothetical protein
MNYAVSPYLVSGFLGRPILYVQIVEIYDVKSHAVFVTGSVEVLPL